LLLPDSSPVLAEAVIQEREANKHARQQVTKLLAPLESQQLFEAFSRDARIIYPVNHDARIIHPHRVDDAGVARET
jgi:hypothetical protein